MSLIAIEDVHFYTQLNMCRGQDYAHLIQILISFQILAVEKLFGMFLLLN